MIKVYRSLLYTQKKCKEEKQSHETHETAEPKTVPMMVVWYPIG